jgi:DNA-binding CsgD family transcriptional regulator
MIRTAKNRVNIAYLRQLCCSGLNEEVIVPEFLKAVQTVIPSDNNIFTGLTERYLPLYNLPGFDLKPPDSDCLEIVNKFFNPSFMRRLVAYHEKYPVITDPSIWQKNFYNTAIYHTFWKPNHQHHVLYVPVSRYGKTTGMLGLFRPKQHQPFSENDQAQLLQLLPYFNHIKPSLHFDEVNYASEGDIGIMVFNVTGQLVYQSREARELFHRACYQPSIMAMNEQSIVLTAKLKQLCQDLVMIFEGKEAKPPSWSHVNGYGLFKFRAQWLNNQQDSSQNFIGISIEHREPLTIKILRALRYTSLSPKQREVAALVAQGLSNQDISRQLNIKLTTVKDYVSHLCFKLNITNREALLPKLLSIEKTIDE